MTTTLFRIGTPPEPVDQASPDQGLEPLTGAPVESPAGNNVVTAGHPAMR